MMKQSGTTWDVEKLLAQGYKSGSIVRVKMLNFLTYDECEVFPGPKLNVVIGPNGTGKSTLTHAICLACCGSANDVGRSSDLAKFVKHGKEGQESYAEVDILMQDRVTNIRRTINSDNKGSKWSLDRKVTTQATIKELMVKYSIDVDNLCSFMPQDKVGNFSRYSPAQILEHTLKSINVMTASEKNLYTEQQELSNLEKHKSELRRDKEAKEMRQQQLEAEQRAMETEIEKLRRRETAIETLRYCEIKHIKLELEHLSDKSRSEELKVEAAENKLETERGKIAPLEVQLRNLKRDQAAKDKACDSVTQKSAKLEQAMRSSRESSDKLETRLEEAALSLQSVEKDRKRLETTLQTTQQELQREEARLSQAQESLPKIQKDLLTNKNAMATANDSLFALNDQQTSVNDKMKGIYNQVQGMTRDLSNLQDPRQVYKDHLLRLSNQNNNYDAPILRDTVSAMELVDRNEKAWRDSGRLRGTIYGPIALHCDVPDKACAAMLEKVVPINRLLGWCVESDADGDFLKNEFREKGGLKIDMFTIKNIDGVLNLPRPFGTGLMKRLTAELGLTGYLSEQLTCPDMVRAMLYSTNFIHTVLWGRHTAQNKREPLDLNLICSEGVKIFKMYIHDTTQSRGNNAPMDITEYSGKKSRFALNLPPSTSIVNIRPKNILQSQRGGDGGEVNEQRATLENNIRELKMQQSDGNKELDRLRGLVVAKEKEVSALKGEKNGLLAAQRQPDNLVNSVKKIRAKLNDNERRLSMDFAAEKKQKEFEYRKSFDHFLNSVEATVASVKEFNAFSVEKGVVLQNKNALLEGIRDVESAIIERRSDLRNFEMELKDAKKGRDRAQEAMDEGNERMTAMALKMAPDDVAPDDRLEHFINVIFPKAFDAVPQNTLAELEQRIAEVENEIRNSVENPNLVRRFEKCKAEILQLHGELEVARNAFANAENGLMERAEEWLRAVKAIAHKLDRRFQKYMQDLSFDGEVKLNQTNNYCDYQMVMKVRFRDDSELVELSGTRHSGGERAVSTVMYLMALQDMTSSPFRVVDEINQGMDERNERLVFDRIVKSCCGDPDRPQYFLVSPKLLQGLRAIDNPDVTALIVLNGPGVKAKYIFSALLQMQMRLAGVEPAELPKRETEVAVTKKRAAAAVKSEKSYKKGRVVEDSDDEF